ncbi:MAG TPA: short-chain dehydrogenase [Chitinophagaceae bacterium]|jgi:hypothetical protein|nr:short-chain dehydrogenase [Chitinophagaceae bacterium]
MTNLVIENFVEAGKRKNKLVRIQFKKREAIHGLFVVSNDYQEMKKKNFWRIVTESREDEWLNTKNLSCSRLYSGDEFTRLSDL